jgi:4-amino-4-deoxy-L-arabinose transferase-like glycosyltransferase
MDQALKQNPILAERTRRSADLLALIAFCGFLFFAGLQAIGLVGADEPRYAQIAREMLQRGDWVTPVLNGQPWLEKPPLYYWATMLAYKATGGASDWAARLPSAILCSLMIFFIYVWARHFRRGMQLDAALITAASAILIGFGRSASTDMPLTAMFTVAMLCWYGWYSNQNRGWLLGFYLFAGLATLAKGPVAVLLAGLIVVIFAALRRDWRLLLRTLWPAGILLYLVVTLPWFVAVQRANSEFFRVFFLQHNLERFNSNLYHHHQPFWYYLPVALLALVPWTVFVIAALVDAIRDWRFSVEQQPGVEDLRTYLTVWFLLPIAFFSLSQSKLPGYILPAIPAGTILLADFIRRRGEAKEKPATWLALSHALLSSFMLVAAYVIPFKMAKQDLAKLNVVVIAALAILCLFSLWLTLHNYGYRVLRLVTLVTVVIAFAYTLKSTSGWINLLQSARPVEAAIHRSVLVPNPAIAVYDVPPSVRYGLGFYANRAIASYEENQIPPFDHLLVAASGSQKELEYRLPGRSVTRLGGFEPQHLDFYVVSGKPSAEAHP